MFTRKICGPRKVIVAVKVGGQVVADPAVDVAASDIQGYRDAAFSEAAMSKIVVKPNEKATVWTVQPLTRKQRRFASTLLGDSPVMFGDILLRCCVLRIEHRLLLDDSGNESDGCPTPDRQDRGGDLGTCASEEWLDKLSPLDDERNAVGSIIWAISEVQGPLSRPSEPPSGAGE